MAAMKEKEYVVAFLGPKASYTHQATLQRYNTKEYHIVPMTSIEDVFAAVQAGSATHGVVPFENSSNGTVDFTLDLFADVHKRYTDIVVQHEIYLPVHHCLVGRPATKAVSTQPPANADVASLQIKDDTESPIMSGQVTPTPGVPQPGKPRVQPSHSIKHIQKIYSHPQAWGQCKTFLGTYAKKAETIDVSSTARAAEVVAADAAGTSAAISSRLAAELNGLDVLAEGIEDSEGNSTRFFVLRRWPDMESVESRTYIAQEVEKTIYKSLVSFSVDHKQAGALADSLAVFRKHELNLTSINTRPSGTRPWQYIFFVEMMGRKRVKGSGGVVNVMLEELNKVVPSCRWLGSWEKMTKD